MKNVVMVSLTTDNVSAIHLRPHLDVGEFYESGRHVLRKSVKWADLPKGWETLV
jgi:hypothetical protein